MTPEAIGVFGYNGDQIAKKIFQGRFRTNSEPRASMPRPRSAAQECCAAVTGQPALSRETTLLLRGAASIFGTTGNSA